MRVRITYMVGLAPTRLTRVKRGRMTIDDEGVTIAGPVPVVLRYADIKSLGFRREPGLFHIVLEANPPVYITPVLLNFFGCVNVIAWPQIRRVYTELHRRLGGPGRCAKCGYDMRQSRERCPECGGVSVSPKA
jgi:hypothetical protein